MALLRRVLAPAPPREPALGALLAVAVGGGAVYGAVMGTFGGVLGERAWQVLYAALKVPLLLLGSLVLCLPSFFVVNALVGLRRDFARVFSALLRAQGAVALVLAALAPYTALFYASSAEYDRALLFNGLLFAIATAGGQLRLRALYRPLVARHPRHRTLLRVWLVLYALVAIQMAWVLRPFVGSPDAPVRFLRPEAWGNAYEVVLRLLLDVVSG